MTVDHIAALAEQPRARRARAPRCLWHRQGGEHSSGRK